MKEFKDWNIEDFQEFVEMPQTPIVCNNLQVSFYKVKEGCYKPDFKNLEYCKLEDVL